MKKQDKKSNVKHLFWGGGGSNFRCRHPKLWLYIKSNVKAFFITGAITFVVTASATTVKILHSRQVRYKNDKSVEQAINELYEKADQLYGYHVGDEISVNGIDFYVIADSGATQDYVVTLKKDPLTVAEINQYGSSVSITASNLNGYGAMRYGDSGEIKAVVDAWTLDNFTSDELKEINGYMSRLINVDEFQMISNEHNWRYSSLYSYWCMGKNNDYHYVSYNRVPYVDSSGTISTTLSTYRYGIVVRPVINIKKSAI